MKFGKTRYYKNVLFKPDVFEAAISKFEAKATIVEERAVNYGARYEAGDDTIIVKNPNITYRRECFSSSYFSFTAQAYDSEHMFLVYDRSSLDISIDGFSDLTSISEIMNEFEANYSSSKISVGNALKNLTVFIGHGRSRQWRDLKDHLSDHHGIKVEAYETGARAGMTIQQVIKDLSSRASLALLVHTGEDVDRDGVLHARENVVHETGIFQAKLGFERAIVLLEDGANEFTNIAGLQQLRFQKNNIKETFGDVLAIIRREFST